MTRFWDRKGDEETGVLDKKANHEVISDQSDTEGSSNGVDDGVGNVNRALKHRHLQMIGIGGGTLQL